MSFYDDASIVMIPTGVKASKLYCAKPTDGSGDLTFTRTGSTATRVDSAGLIEECRTNLTLRSEEFNNATWVKFNATVSGNVTASPTGTLTADSLIDNATNASHFVFQTYTFVAAPHTVSVYAKANTLSNIILMMYDGTTFFVSGRFDLLNGTVIGNGNILNVGNGWYRCSFTATTLAASGNVYVQLNNGTSSSYAGTGQSVFIWGFQTEIGNVATNYIPTTSAAVTVGPIANLPRLDYTGGGCPKLLMEPTRTNSVIYSEMFDNAAWTKSLTDVSGNMIVSPDGYQSADFLIPNTTLSSSHRVERGGGSVTTGNTYTGSVFVKYGGYDYVNIELTNFLAASFTYRFSTGVISNASGAGLVAGSPKAENYGNGWIRLSLSSTLPSGNGTAQVRINFRSNTNGANFAGDGVSGVYAWGYQLELGPHPTSYIPTWNASVTRNQDEFVKSSITSLIGQTEGTLFLDFVFANQFTTPEYFGLSNGTATDRVLIGLSNVNSIVSIVSSNDVIQSQITKTDAIVGQRYKCAISYKQNDFAFYINGVQVGLDLLGSVPLSLNSLVISAGGSTFRLFEPINQILVFKTRLSNSDLATLTTI